ncbi:MAG TPA: LCP family protein [Micromonosporaceae bacterium]|nr:LCP family protein [Micromonosporaceae bacterium]
MARKMRLIGVAALAAAVLIATGVVVTVRLIAHRIDSTIPQADLFGTPSATPTPSPTPSPTPPPGWDIEGPLNILIIGEDTRPTRKTAPHNDANLILHVSKDLKSAYLTSLPRDLLVDIPAFKPSGTPARRTKLTHAMTYGSKVPGGYDTKQGFQLVFQTIGNYTGIKEFDAGVLFSFEGMRDFVDEIGGIDIYVDEYTRSIHRQPNGKYRQSCPSCPNRLGGPQQVYEVGLQHMVGWQALDYARQRYGLKGGAYGRERHHRQIVRAVMAQLIKQDLVLNPAKADRVLQAVGKGVIFDGRGRTPSEFGFALRHLRPENVTLIGLPGGSVYSGGTYVGEALNKSVKDSYFKALREDRLDEWVKEHPQYVNSAEP